MHKNFSVLHGPTVNFIAPNWYAHKRMIRIMMKTISNKITMNRDADENYNDSIEISNGLKVEHNGHLATKKNGIHGSSFTGALHILCNEVYHLKDAFPELCKEYGIISAIPISSCTAERMQLFCAKACENTIEVYDGAEEAGRLLLLSAERKTLTKENRFICTFILSPLKCVIVVPLQWLYRST